MSDRDEVPPATGPNQVIVFTRGVCFFSIKVESGQMAGYDMVVVANSHGGSRNGLLPDCFFELYDDFRDARNRALKDDQHLRSEWARRTAPNMEKARAGSPRLSIP